MQVYMGAHCVTLLGSQNSWPFLSFGQHVRRHQLTNNLENATVTGAHTRAMGRRGPNLCHGGRHNVMLSVDYVGQLLNAATNVVRRCTQAPKWNRIDTCRRPATDDRPAEQDDNTTDRPSRPTNQHVNTNATLLTCIYIYRALSLLYHCESVDRPSSGITICAPTSVLFFVSSQRVLWGAIKHMRSQGRARLGSCYLEYSYNVEC